MIGFSGPIRRFRHSSNVANPRNIAVTRTTFIRSTVSVCTTLSMIECPGSWTVCAVYIHTSAGTDTVSEANPQQCPRYNALYNRDTYDVDQRDIFSRRHAPNKTTQRFQRQRHHRRQPRYLWTSSSSRNHPIQSICCTQGRKNRCNGGKPRNNLFVCR